MDGPAGHGMAVQLVGFGKNAATSYFYGVPAAFWLGADVVTGGQGPSPLRPASENDRFMAVPKRARPTNILPTVLCLWVAAAALSRPSGHRGLLVVHHARPFVLHDDGEHGSFPVLEGQLSNPVVSTRQKPACRHGNASVLRESAGRSVWLK